MTRKPHKAELLAKIKADWLARIQAKQQPKPSKEQRDAK
jgi:hypothetical protein